MRADREQLENAQKPIEGSLRPSEAIARALLNNRERRVQALRSALKSRQLDAAQFNMLPSLTARAGYSERSEFAASQSVPFRNGQPVTTGGGQTFSVSQEKERSTYGVDFTWSILDFGLSYVRAQQKADQYLIAQEEERKAAQTLAQDVRRAYWKAVSADRLLDKVGPLMAEVDDALAKSRQIERENLTAPMNALSYQRGLLDIKRSLESLRDELIGAEERLARLMGLPPGTKIPLPSYEDSDFTVPDLPLHKATMESTALLLRPEIRTAVYKQRISRDEVWASVLQMFPDLSLTAGYQHDSNRFLAFNDWTTVGAQVGWDLLGAFKANQDRRAAEMATKVARERRLAASIAVLTQVHLAVVDFRQGQRTLQTAKSYLDVSRGISNLVERQESTDARGRLQVIKERLNALVAELRRDLAYAEIQNDFARIFKSMGLNPYPGETEDPNRLAELIETRQAQWREGQFGVVIRPISDQQPRLRADDGPPSFRFAKNTFSVAGDVTYTAKQVDGAALPEWLAFDPATRTFRVRDPERAEPVSVLVRAENEKGIYARDRFTLKPGSSG